MTAPETPDTPPTPTLGAFAATPFAIALVVAVRGGVLAKLWAWFVVPLGVAHLSWLHACGIAVTWTALAQRNDGTRSAEQLTGSRVLRNAVGSASLLAITLGVGAVVAWLR